MADFNSTPVDLKSPSDALEFEEYEKLEKQAKAAPPVQGPPAKTEKPPAEPADKAGSQTAGESGTPQPTQDKGKKPERKPDAEKRIADLIAKNHELERKFAELQKNGAQQATPPASVKPAEEAKPAAPPPSADGRPKLQEYFNKYPEKDLSEVYALYNRDDFNWLHKQAQAERDQQEAQQTERQLWQKKIAERPDVPYEAIAGHADDPGSGISLSLNFGVLKKQFPNWLDVLYHLHDNSADYQRMRAMTPQDQYFEFGLMARQLKAGPIEPAQAAAPEKPTNVRSMVSRLPAPQKTVLSGSMPAPKRSLSEATSFEEAEAIERQRTGSGR